MGRNIDKKKKKAWRLEWLDAWNLHVSMMNVSLKWVGTKCYYFFSILGFVTTAPGWEFGSSNSQYYRRNQPKLQEQSFVCGECGKGYKWMHNLSRHQRLECGKPPCFNCGFCDKRFYRLYRLTQHMSQKHGWFFLTEMQIYICEPKSHTYLLSQL